MNPPTIFRELGIHKNYADRDIVLNTNPIVENIELTNFCNFSCNYCVSKKRKRFHMSIELFRQIMEENRELMENRLVWLHFSGEPLLYPYLEEAINICVENGVKPRFSTNVSLLDKKKSESVLNSGLSQIVFSVDAVNEKTYYNIRGEKCFNEVVENIHNFLDMKEEFGLEKPETQVQLVKNKFNQQEITDFIDYWKKTSVDWINIKSLSTRAGNVRGEEFLKQQRFFYNDDGLGRFPCIWLWRALIILSNGNVVPCCSDFNQDMIMGNVKSANLKQIWNNEKYTFLRKRHVQGKYPSICKQCKEREGYSENFFIKLFKEIVKHKKNKIHRLIKNEKNK